MLGASNRCDCTAEFGSKRFFTAMWAFGSGLVKQVRLHGWVREQFFHSDVGIRLWARQTGAIVQLGL